MNGLTRRLDERAIRECPVLGCHDASGHPRALVPDRPVCAECVERLTRYLAKAPTMFAALRGREQPAGGNQTGPISGSKAPGVPLDVHACATASALARTLAEWADTALVLAGQQSRDARASTRDEWLLTWALSALDTYAHTLWTHPYYAPLFAASLDTQLRHMWNLLGYGTGRHNLQHPCPRCDMLTLTHYSGLREYVACRFCHLVWDESTFHIMVRQWTEGHTQR